MRITPLAPTGTTVQYLNPELPALPDFLVDTTVTTALSPDGKTLLILTSGFNQNLHVNGNVDPSSSNEYVFVFDVSGQTPRQAQVIQIVANAFDDLAWNPSGRTFYVSGGPDDLVHVFNADARGTWQEGTTIPLNHNGVANGWNGIIPVAAGLDVTKDGKYLLVANYENDIHLAMRRHKSIAKVAMGRRLAVRLYWMWQKSSDYSRSLDSVRTRDNSVADMVGSRTPSI